ncbi:MAG: GNAT family N-acetyltransferase [Ruminococcaceae bacterium]|nr:GNAT family N-acetyltransferase [Oscillospiraceae bacterium]
MMGLCYHEAAGGVRMLIIAGSLRELDFEQLAQVYDYERNDAAEFYDYLSQCFFTVKGSVYCLWQVEGHYRSALRLEPYQDGLLLTGLETAPQWRRRGYAKGLMGAVLQWLGGDSHRKIYSHIRFDNKPSLAVHQRCGFRRIMDYAVLLDGTVSSQIGTFLCTLGASV